ncbi:MAG: KAP family P-loop NTPase fold protein [Verrucomicrobiota bacterium]
MAGEERNESVIVKKFLDFLRAEKQYPELLLKNEFRVLAPNGETAQIDIVLLNSDSVGFLAVFELKNDLNRLKSRQERLRLLDLARMSGSNVYGAYLVGPNTLENRRFTIFRVFDADRYVEVPESDFPSYEDLQKELKIAQPERNSPKVATKNLKGNATRIESIAQASVGDQPTVNDTLGFTPYVDAIARFLLNTETRPPLTLSVEGEWGCGKSSFMRQLQQRLEAANSSSGRKTGGGTVRTVWFNAWRHDKNDALWAAFALEFVRQISEKMSFGARWYAAWLLTKKRFDWKSGWLDVVQWLFVSLAWITLTISGIYLWCLGAVTLQKVIGGQWLADWLKDLLTVALASGGVFSFLAATFYAVKKAGILLGNPLKHDLKKHLKAIDYVERIAFVEKFHDDFAKILDAYTGGDKVFVFIDDLDRCEVPAAAELMQALNLMIADDNQIVFVIGMDREKVAAGLTAKHDKLLPYLFTDESDEKSSDYSAVKNSEYGLAFIEKFIQLPFRVPAPGPENLAGFLSQLKGEGKDTSRERVGEVPSNPIVKGLNIGGDVSESGVMKQADSGTANAEHNWEVFELRISQDSDGLHDIIKMVAPALDYNPRKLKQFVNVFRLRAYICFDTGLFNSMWQDDVGRLTFEKLAKFVAIGLRWPMLMFDLHNDPDLLSKIVAERGPTEKIAARWRKKRRLIELIKFRAPTDPIGLAKESEWPRFSLQGLTVQQLMRVSPSIPRLSKKSPDDVVSDKSVNLDSNGDDETNAAADIHSQAERFRLSGYFSDAANAYTILLKDYSNSVEAQRIRDLAKGLHAPDSKDAMAITSVSEDDVRRINRMYASMEEIVRAYPSLDANKREALDKIFGEEIFRTRYPTRPE